MITFQKLKWNNCFSYGKNNYLDLNKDRLSQIIAKNGSGKSSVILILEEVLFNKNSKGIKKADIPNRLGDGTYDIELEFSVDDVEYKIVLNRNKTLKLKLFANKEDISSHTAINTFKTIERIIGVDFKTFSQLVHQSPHSSLQFLTATDTNRKKFLIDLLGLEQYLEYHEIFKDRAKEISLSISEATGVVNTVQRWLGENKLEDVEKQKPLSIDDSTEILEKELSLLDVEYKNIANTNKKINQNTNKKERIKDIDISVIAAESLELIDTTVISSKLGGLKTKQLAIKEIVDKIKSLGDKCPTCKQTIENDFKTAFIKDKKEEFDLVKGQYANLSEELEKSKSHNEEVKNKIKLKEEFERLYASIDKSLPEETIVEVDILNKIDLIKKQLKSKRDKINKIISENAKIEQHNMKIDIYLSQSAKFLTQLEEETVKLDNLKNDLSNIETLKKAFSTNGLLAYKIENLVKDLEILVNEYLVELSSGRFTLDFSIEKDKLNVNLTDNGAPISITALSSGELSRVNISTLLAIRKLMDSISRSKINLLFLDEVINVLDSEGREKLVELLSKEEHLTSFIVSHQWEHPLLTKVSIIKERGISRIENAD